MNVRQSKRFLLGFAGLAIVIMYGVTRLGTNWYVLRRLAPDGFYSELSCFEACSSNREAWGPHRMAVLVPYRGAFEELLVFVPHLHKFLNEHRTRHEIVIVNQVDSFRFNRASLINVGCLMTEDEFDYFAIHDIDILPLNPSLRYDYPDKGPYHLSPPEYHPLNHRGKFFSGILLFTYKDFKKIRGMTNKKWGWGGEDCELRSRVFQSDLKVQRPSGLTSGFNTFLNIHDESVRPRDKARKNAEEDANNYIIDQDSGVDNVAFTLQSKVRMVIEGAPLTVFNVMLECDPSKTPWCDPGYEGG